MKSSGLHGLLAFARARICPLGVLIILTGGDSVVVFPIGLDRFLTLFLGCLGGSEETSVDMADFGFMVRDDLGVTDRVGFHPRLCIMDDSLLRGDPEAEAEADAEGESLLDDSWSGICFLGSHSLSFPLSYPSSSS